MIGKFDCRVFCHISSLGDKISNTAATIQPNLFGFGKIAYMIKDVGIFSTAFKFSKRYFTKKEMCFWTLMVNPEHGQSRTLIPSHS